MALKRNCNQTFLGWNAADFRWDSVGNTVPPGGDDARATDITLGLQAILQVMQAKAAGATSYG